jgi:hypothetical protein
MGWTWALWWCQSVHERIVNEVGADDSNRLTDKRPAPSTTPALHTEYVDNFHVFGTDKKEVKELSFRGAQALRNKGLVVHEEEFHDPATGSSATVLGWEFTPQNIVRPSRHRAWRIRLAIRAILARGAVSGVDLEKVIGNVTFIALARREALSVLGSVYGFIKKFYCKEAVLWDSVKRELRIFDGLIPLLWRKLDAEWSSQVLCVDASTWGLGAVVAEVEPDQVREAGQYSERWRYVSDGPEGARATAARLEKKEQSVGEPWQNRCVRVSGSVDSYVDVATDTE